MKLAGVLFSILVPIAIIVGGLELGLRFFPYLIPLELLQHFDDELRLEIAIERNLPNRDITTIVERDDGGPLLRKYLPKVSVTQDHGDVGTTLTNITDDLGFCNSQANSYDKERIEIIAIGDSLTWCNSVEADEAWPAFLGKELGMSVYNLGFPGIGIYEYLVFLRAYGLAKKPKIVVMNFTEGNDLRDALRYWRFKERKTVALEDNKEPHENPIASLLGNLSYSYNMALGAYKEIFQSRARDATGEGSVADARLASIDKKDLNSRYTLDFGSKKVPFNAGNADRDELMHSIVVAEGLIPKDIFDEGLKEFKRLSEEHDFIPLITYSPSAHVAYQKYAVYEEKWVKPISETYSKELRELMAERAQLFSINYLDLTDILRDEIERQGTNKAEKLLYYPGSIHYSIEGNRVIAKAMANVLRHLATLNVSEQ